MLAKGYPSMANSALFVFVAQLKAQKANGWVWSGMIRLVENILANIKATNISNVKKHKLS